MREKIKSKIASKASLRKSFKPVRKRCIKLNKITKSKTLKIFGINAAGIKSKTESFNEILSRLQPQIWMIEETKLKENENIKGEALKNFQVFYKSRHETQGGGLAIGINKMLESTFVNEGDEETEVMSVVVFVGKLQIRIIVGYGVQENATKDKKDKFWEFIENEVKLRCAITDTFPTTSDICQRW